VAPTTTTIVTPGFEVSGSRFAVPGVGVLALGSAVGALEVTKRPRKRLRGQEAAQIETLEGD
jgi:hypothetical protein